MTNEPVAYRHWMIDEEFPEDSSWEYFDAPTGEDCKECIPLYTHPAKTLTDEEIEPLILKMPYEPSENELYEFAYDVLRKAQEK